MAPAVGKLRRNFEKFREILKRFLGMFEYFKGICGQK